MTTHQHLLYSITLTVDQLDDINWALEERERKRTKECELRRAKTEVKNPRQRRGHIVTHLEPQVDGTARVIKGLFHQQPSPPHKPPSPKLQIINTALPDITALKI